MVYFVVNPFFFLETSWILDILDEADVDFEQ